MPPGGWEYGHSFLSLQQIPQKNAVIPSFGGMGMMGFAGNNMPMGRKRRASGGSESETGDQVIRTTVVSGNGISLRVDSQPVNQ